MCPALTLPLCLLGLSNAPIYLYPLPQKPTFWFSARKWNNYTGNPSSSWHMGLMLTHHGPESAHSQGSCKQSTMNTKDWGGLANKTFGRHCSMPVNEFPQLYAAQTRDGTSQQGNLLITPFSLPSTSFFLSLHHLMLAQCLFLSLVLWGKMTVLASGSQILDISNWIESFHTVYHFNPSCLDAPDGLLLLTPGKKETNGLVAYRERSAGKMEFI